MHSSTSIWPLPLSRAAISVAAACTHAAFIALFSSVVIARISRSASPTARYAGQRCSIVDGAMTSGFARRGTCPPQYGRPVSRSAGDQDCGGLAGAETYAWGMDHGGPDHVRWARR